MTRRLLLACCAGLLATAAQAATWYVKTDGNDTAGGTDWDNALRTISNGVAKASAPDTVLVSNGNYTLTAVIAIAKGIRLQSVNGPDFTSIDGNYPAVSIRCLTVTHADAVVEGFTLSNGVSGTQGGGVYLTAGTVCNCVISGNRGTDANCYGGGIYVGGGVLSNCVVDGNLSYYRAGGVYYVSGTVRDCRIINNVASNAAGGIYTGSGTIQNCIISGNSSKTSYGGGVYLGTGGTLRNCLIYANYATNYCGGGVEVESLPPHFIQNCTIVSNVALNQGAGIRFQYSNAFVQNTIIYYNKSLTDAASNYNVYIAPVSFAHCCLAPAVPASSSGSATNNIVADPLLVNMPEDSHLSKGSPCINTGMFQDWMTGAVDLDGRPRIRLGAVDIGAYEYFPQGAVIKFQ